MITYLELKLQKFECGRNGSKKNSRLIMKLNLLKQK